VIRFGTSGWRAVIAEEFSGKSVSLDHLVDILEGAIIKRRARELRALGEAKAAAFRQSQLGRTLRVLTLRPDDPYSRSTPALSSNYLRVRIVGAFSANLWLDLQVTAEEEMFLTGAVFTSGEGQHTRIPVSV